MIVICKINQVLFFVVYFVFIFYLGPSNKRAKKASTELNTGVPLSKSSVDTSVPFTTTAANTAVSSPTASVDSTKPDAAMPHLQPLEEDSSFTTILFSNSQVIGCVIYHVFIFV